MSGQLLLCSVQGNWGCHFTLLPFFLGPGGRLGPELWPWWYSPLMSLLGSVKGNMPPRVAPTHRLITSITQADRAVCIPSPGSGSHSWSLRSALGFTQPTATSAVPRPSSTRGAGGWGQCHSSSGVIWRLQ